MCYDRYIVVWLLQEPNKEIMYTPNDIVTSFTSMGLPVDIVLSYGGVVLDCGKLCFQLTQRAIDNQQEIVRIRYALNAFYHASHHARSPSFIRIIFAICFTHIRMAADCAVPIQYMHIRGGGVGRWMTVPKI